MHRFDCWFGGYGRLAEREGFRELPSRVQLRCTTKTKEEMQSYLEQKRKEAAVYR